MHTSTPWAYRSKLAPYLAESWQSFPEATLGESKNSSQHVPSRFKVGLGSYQPINARSNYALRFLLVWRCTQNVPSISPVSVRIINDGRSANTANMKVRLAHCDSRSNVDEIPAMLQKKNSFV
jgi:hypothetical protein